MGSGARRWYGERIVPEDNLDLIERKLRDLPKRSISPSPESGAAVHVEVGGIDFRLRKKAVPGWAWVPIMAAMSAVGTGIVGYYGGLRAAGARLAALERAFELRGEELARLKVQVESIDKGLNHESWVNQDQDKKLDRLGAPLMVNPAKPEAK